MLRDYAWYGMTDETRLSEQPVAGVDRRNGAVVIHLVGELDLYNAPRYARRS